MPSPFPGMDPFLEPFRRDVHTGLIGEARRVLNRSLPAGLVARAEERLTIESADGFSQRVGPDVSVFSPAAADPNEDGGVLIDAPYKLVVDSEPSVERYIRILDEGGTLITTVEFLSPSNKRIPGLADYRDNRRQLLQAGVHVVEVDLIRAGDWRALLRPAVAPSEAALAPYRAVIHTAGRRPAAYFFPIALGTTLPVVPVPLRPNEPPSALPLQTMLDNVYADGRY